MKSAGYSAFKAQLLDRPSVISTGRCAVCGRKWTQRHHVVQKGAGGVSPETDRRIPLIELCEDCHGMVHRQRRLHLHWFDGLGGWAYYISRHAMDDQLAATMHMREFRPLPGWLEQKRWGDVIGARR